MRHQRQSAGFVRGAIVVMAAAVLVAACSSGGSSKAATSTSRSTSSSSSTSTTNGATTGASATVNVADSQYGKILVDSEGRTLYLYTPNQGTTNSVPAAILAAWPPLLATGTPVAGAGLDQAKLTSAPQAGGTFVAYNGNLLYRFAADSAAGQTKGQGVGGIWYVVSQDGAKITG